MNINIFEKYKEDFKRALNIYENEYSHDELIDLIKSGSVVEKQTAVLKLELPLNQNDVDILMQNLTGCDGKIREAVSFRLKEFIPEYPEFFIKYCDIFLDAIVDINGNICRNTIFAIKFLKQYNDFCNEFSQKLCANALELAIKAKDFDIQEGKYKINKEIFKLYWYLEALAEFCEFADLDILEKILCNSKLVKDYTIREKTAKILSKIDKFQELKDELKNDENYYVRRKF